jgi:hypothetical protein
MPRWKFTPVIPVFALIFVLPSFAEEPKSESLRDWVKQNTSRHAVGLYVQGKKIGWMVAELKLGRHADRDVAVETSELRISMKSDGEVTELKQKSVTYYSLDGDGPIIGAEETGTQDKQDTVYTVLPSANGLSITGTVGKRKTQREVPLPKANLAISRKLMQWLSGKPAVGASFDHYGTSWDEKDVDQKEVFTFKGTKTILWGGVQTEVYLVRIDMQGAKFDAEVLANGNPVRGKLGPLIEMRAEAEEVAKKLDAANIDMVAASSIKVDMNLGNAKQVVSLTMEVTGVQDFTLPTSHRQTTREENGKVVLRLRADFVTGKTSPLSDAERKKFTEATPTVQSDQEPIRKLAAEIVGAETDPVKKAGLLKDWVYKSLRKTMACNASTALAVLDNKAGDCTEHTLLFVSLARAVGLPARELTGVAYVSPIFGWHAWAEIHDGKQWISVDPTWNELYVDATHIVFSHDMDNHSWLNVLGSVGFRVLDFTTKE